MARFVNSSVVELEGVPVEFVSTRLDPTSDEEDMLASGEGVGEPGKLGLVAGTTSEAPRRAETSPIVSATIKIPHITSSIVFRSHIFFCIASAWAMSGEGSTSCAFRTGNIMLSVVANVVAPA